MSSGYVSGTTRATHSISPCQPVPRRAKACHDAPPTNLGCSRHETYEHSLAGGVCASTALRQRRGGVGTGGTATAAAQPPARGGRGRAGRRSLGNSQTRAQDTGTGSPLPSRRIVTMRPGEWREGTSPSRSLSLNPPTGLWDRRFGAGWPLGWCVCAGRSVLGRAGLECGAGAVGGAWGSAALRGALSGGSDELGQVADSLQGGGEGVCPWPVERQAEFVAAAVVDEAAWHGEEPVADGGRDGALRCGEGASEAADPPGRTTSSINASKPSLDITVPASNNPPSATKDPSSNTASNPSIPPDTLLTGSASSHGQNDRSLQRHSPTSGGLSRGRANPRSLTAAVDSGLEPYVTVSRHTAPAVRRGVEARRCQ